MLNVEINLWKLSFLAVLLVWSRLELAPCLASALKLCLNWWGQFHRADEKKKKKTYVGVGIVIRGFLFLGSGE